MRLTRGCAPGEGVLIDEALDLEHDLRARSILLHELVHYVDGSESRRPNQPSRGS